MSGGGLSARPTTPAQQLFFAEECGLVILHSSLIMRLSTTAKTTFKPFVALALRVIGRCRTFSGEFRGVKWAI